MGFIIQYKRFFSVSFYEEESNEPLNGFSFFATSETQKVLRNYNLVFRPHSSGFLVYYCASPEISITERIRFTIGFTFSDTGLFEKFGLTKTDDDDTTVYEPGLCFDNLKPDRSVITTDKASLVASGEGPDERVAAEDTRHIYPQTFNLTHSTKVSIPENYILKHQYDSSIEQTVPVAEADDMQTITTTINSIDMGENYISKPGPYLLKTTSPASTRNIYLNNELGKKSARGVIDIFWETAQNTVADETGQQYNITFKPK
jgi:hypothetical protein